MSKELLQQAIAALTTAVNQNQHDMLMTDEECRAGEKAIAEIEAAIAQPEQIICGSQNPKYEPQTSLLLTDATQTLPPSLQIAAQSVLDRWDSPQWKWVEHGPTADLMNDLRAALSQPTVVKPKIPGNITNHRSAWRKAIQIAIDVAVVKAPDIDDKVYWAHELAAFDRTFDGLLAMIEDPGAQPVQPKAADHE